MKVCPGITGAPGANVGGTNGDGGGVGGPWVGGGVGALVGLQSGFLQQESLGSVSIGQSAGKLSYLGHLKENYNILKPNCT